MAPAKKKAKTYDQNDVYKGLAAMEKGESSRKAADKFNVPRSTLYSKYREYVPVDARPGPNTVLTFEEENSIASWILYCGSRGYPVTKTMLLNTVEEIIVRLKRKNPFKEDKPGRSWWEGFRKRHPDIVSRICQNLTTSRLSATESALRGWFQEVHDHINPLKLEDIDASRVYNLDESAFFLIPKGEKVLARKGSKSVYKVVNGDDKESLTVLFTVGANGVMLPPMILFWYERIPSYIAKSLPKEWIAGTTEKGWMTADCFFKYISGQFYPWLIKNEIEFPVILYVDGHSSHITLELCKFCREHRIEVIALYPNATHIIQPLDVSVFSPLKKQYRKQVDNWRMQNNGEKMTRQNFAPVLKDCLDSMENLPQMIINGFATTGLHPFSPDSVDYNVLNKMPKSKKKSILSENLPSQHDSSIKQSNAKISLQVLEKNIPQEIIQNFQEVLLGNTSISDVSNIGLFNHWKFLKGVSNDNGKLQF